MRMRLNKLIILLFLFPLSCAFGQLNSFDYMTPKEYTIAGIVVDDVRNLDHNLIAARKKLGHVVGRDVTQLDKKSLLTNDFYKSAHTLDSMTKEIRVARENHLYCTFSKKLPNFSSRIPTFK